MENIGLIYHKHISHFGYYVSIVELHYLIGLIYAFVVSGDGLRAAGVGTTHWAGGQTTFVVPLHQEPVEQLFGAFPFAGCEEGVPQSNFNGM